MAEAISKELGIEFDPEWIPEEERGSVKGIVNFLTDVIKENSQPQYSKDEAKRFDEYLAKGGSPKKFFEVYYGDGVDYSSLDASPSVGASSSVGDYSSAILVEVYSLFLHLVIILYLVIILQQFELKSTVCLFT